ncbi:MAG: GNAT family N-acetyltransferase [Chloroflexota bacterium]
MKIELKKSKREDAPFIYELVEKTMSDYIIALWGSWDREQLVMQTVGFAEDQNGCLIYVDAAKAGFLLVNRLDTHIELAQLFLLPKFQGAGVGTSLMKQLVADAQTDGKPIKLRGLSPNPAWKFYQELGFTVVKKTKERFFMAYHPDSLGK